MILISFVWHAGSTAYAHVCHQYSTPPSTHFIYIYSIAYSCPGKKIAEGFRVALEHSIKIFLLHSLQRTLYIAVVVSCHNVYFLSTYETTAKIYMHTLHCIIRMCVQNKINKLTE